jgi:hypothetical protein
MKEDDKKNHFPRAFRESDGVRLASSPISAPWERL